VTTATKLLGPLTVTTAPEASRETLKQIEKAFGFVPNLMATFANAPTLLNGYMALDAQYAKGTLRATEREVIQLAASVENQCTYCTAAHATVGKQMLKVPAEIIDAIRAGRLDGNDRLIVLAATVREIVNKHGHVSDAVVNRFLGAGYMAEQLLEVLVGMALKTMSNFTDNIFHVEVDAAFASEK
jgi:uncharacterized peroxidase-related enzyme